MLLYYHIAISSYYIFMYHIIIDSVLKYGATLLLVMPLRSRLRFCAHAPACAGVPPPTRGAAFSRCVVSTVVPSVTGPDSAFFRFSFTSTRFSSTSTLRLSFFLHSSSISFSFCSRLLSAKGGTARHRACCLAPRGWHEAGGPW